MSERLVITTNQSKPSKNLLHYVSNRLVRPTSVANAAFLLATPINCTPCSCALQYHAGKGRQQSRRVLHHRCMHLQRAGYVLYRALVLVEIVKVIVESSTCPNNIISILVINKMLLLRIHINANNCTRTFLLSRRVNYHPKFD